MKNWIQNLITIGVFSVLTALFVVGVCVVKQRLSEPIPGIVEQHECVTTYVIAPMKTGSCLWQSGCHFAMILVFAVIISLCLLAFYGWLCEKTQFFRMPESIPCLAFIFILLILLMFVPGFYYMPMDFLISKMVLHPGRLELHGIGFLDRQVINLDPEKIQRVEIRHYLPYLETRGDTIGPYRTEKWRIMIRTDAMDYFSEPGNPTFLRAIAGKLGKPAFENTRIHGEQDQVKPLDLTKP